MRRFSIPPSHAMPSTEPVDSRSPSDSCQRHFHMNRSSPPSSSTCGRPGPNLAFDSRGKHAVPAEATDDRFLGEVWVKTERGRLRTPLTPRIEWLRGLDLNQRPLGYEASACRDVPTTPNDSGHLALYGRLRLWIPLGLVGYSSRPKHGHVPPSVEKHFLYNSYFPAARAACSISRATSAG